MRRVSMLLAGTAIAFGLAATAYAEADKAGKTGKQGFRTEFFQRLDADKDGKITKAEYDAARAGQFKAADKNGDGFLGQEEFAAHGDERRAAFADRLFARLDKNGDGKLDAAELASRRGMGKRPGQSRAGRLDFERADAAKKGFLTVEDLAKLRGERFEARLKKRFERFDTNRDGKLAGDELPDRAKERILRADADKDGAVTFAEYVARPRAFLVRRIEVEFKALDADSDGKLTKAEVDAARGKPMLLLLADADKDGFVTKAELAKSFANRRAAIGDRIFAALDADKDGKISAAEWQASGGRRFARLDRNKDGAVMADELGRRGRRR